MARIRSVSPDICTDLGLVGLSGDAERLWVRLWTHLDDDGRCEDDVLLLKAALFPRHRHIDEHDIDRWVNELIANGQLIRYERNGHRLLSAKPDAWGKYQKPRRRVESKYPAPTRADIVGTRADSGGHCPTGGVDGDGGEIGEEGESEGEPERPSLDPSPVDNPVTGGLVAKAAQLGERFALKPHLSVVEGNPNPAADASQVVSSAASVIPAKETL